MTVHWWCGLVDIGALMANWICEEGDVERIFDKFD